MNIPDILKEGLVESFIERGNIYRINMDRSNGIIPKKDDNNRNKFFVVIGFDEEGNIYGGVIINSSINQNIRWELKILHMPIKKSKYDFLNYDSYIDCSSIKTANISCLSKGNYKGKLDNEDFQLMIETIKSSPVITEIEKNKYNL